MNVGGDLGVVESRSFGTNQRIKNATPTVCRIIDIVIRCSVIGLYLQ
jgi:hypothetical protein